MSERLREFIASRLLPSLGHEGRPFTVMEPAEAGTRSTIHTIRVDGVPPLLVREFAHRRQAVRNVQALRHLEALGLPAPRLVAHDLSWTGRALAGLASWPYVTVESWIEGRRLSSLVGPEERRAGLAQVAELLARFRQATRGRWGRPAHPSHLPFTAFTLFHARRMVARIRSRGWLHRDEASRLKDALASWREPIGGLRPFSLLHKDANPDNFIQTASGDVVPVDLHRLAYGLFPEDVVTALDHFCPLGQGGADIFLRTYFAHAPEARATFDRSRPFFESLYFLKKLYRRAIHDKAASPDEVVEQYRRLALSLRPPP